MIEGDPAENGNNQELSSISRDLCALLFEAPLYRSKDGGRAHLMRALASDLENWVCLPDDVGKVLVAQWEKAIFEVESLSDEACEILYSVMELAQTDHSLRHDRSAHLQKWFDFLQAQNKTSYRAPIILDIEVERRRQEPYRRWRKMEGEDL